MAVLAVGLSLLAGCGGHDAASSAPKAERSPGAEADASPQTSSSPSSEPKLGSEPAPAASPDANASGEASPPPADGAMGRSPSADARFRDDGDGTITDLRTGLVWEKKCRYCPGLHDVESSFYWSGDGHSETIWDWLDDVNDENGKGLAGHRDWRIPNVKELMTIVEYDHGEPAVDGAFAREACDDGCDDAREPACSCTAPTDHWTSTTFADFPAHADVVGFDVGLVNDQAKTLAFPVRAVRGGS
jgi:Protein of unknown function (DUF1566)